MLGREVIGMQHRAITKFTSPVYLLGCDLPEITDWDRKLDRREDSQGASPFES